MRKQIIFKITLSWLKSTCDFYVPNIPVHSNKFIKCHCAENSKWQNGIMETLNGNDEEQDYNAQQ